MVVDDDRLVVSVLRAEAVDAAREVLSNIFRSEATAIEIRGHTVESNQTEENVGMVCESLLDVE